MATVVQFVADVSAATLWHNITGEGILSRRFKLNADGSWIPENSGCFAMLKFCNFSYKFESAFKSPGAGGRFLVYWKVCQRWQARDSARNRVALFDVYLHWENLKW